MKLATIKNNTRDGQLIVVNKALTKAVKVPEIAMTMQQALDDWQHIAPRLNKVYEQLNQDAIDSFNFNPCDMAAPLPRCYQWADGSAYVNHVELVRTARGAKMPENFWTDPLMYQGGSDSLLGPCDDILAGDEAWGIDFEAEVVVITTDVPRGVSIKAANKAICLIGIINDVSFRNLIPNELAKGFGFFQSKPSTAFAPVVVTPSELGDAWHGAKAHLPLVTHHNGKLVGEPNAGIDMTFNFAQLIVHATKTRSLTAGTIIGSGTISNVDRSRGSSCLAEKRMLEKILDDNVKTEFMKFGDKVRIEMFDKDKQSIFGAIDQTVVKYHD